MHFFFWTNFSLVSPSGFGLHLFQCPFCSIFYFPFTTYSSDSQCTYPKHLNLISLFLLLILFLLSWSSQSSLFPLSISTLSSYITILFQSHSFLIHLYFCFYTIDFVKLRSHERFYVSVAHFIWRRTRKKPLDSVLVKLEVVPVQLASDTVIYATSNQRWTADGRCATSHVFRVAIASQWWYSPCSSSFEMRLTYLGRTSLV